MPSRVSRELIVIVVFTIVAVVVAAMISYVLLTPYLSDEPRAPILLDKTVTFTDDFYEQRYSLTLREGDKLRIQVSGFGQPLDFEITGENLDEILVDKPDVSSFDASWTVPKDGTYLFHISAIASNVKARITISKI